jgi:hypothetical protein
MSYMCDMINALNSGGRAGIRPDAESEDEDDDENEDDVNGEPPRSGAVRVGAMNLGGRASWRARALPRKRRPLQRELRRVGGPWKTIGLLGALIRAAAQHRPSELVPGLAGASPRSKVHREFRPAGARNARTRRPRSCPGVGWELVPGAAGSLAGAEDRDWGDAQHRPGSAGPQPGKLKWIKLDQAGSRRKKNLRRNT